MLAAGLQPDTRFKPLGEQLSKHLVALLVPFLLLLLVVLCHFLLADLHQDRVSQSMVMEQT